MDVLSGIHERTSLTLENTERKEMKIMSGATAGNDQLDLLGHRKPIVHYFDHNGALRSGMLVRKIEKGKSKGLCVVTDWEGHKFIPSRIRNIEYSKK